MLVRTNVGMYDCMSEEVYCGLIITYISSGFLPIYFLNNMAYIDEL